MLNKLKNKLDVRLSAVVATDQNWAIGKNNTIPWRVPSDLKNFKNITMGNHIIMGRKTYDSIGKPLPGRMSIVCTQNRSYTAPGSVVVFSLEDALRKCPPGEEVFVVGGEGIYKQLFPIIDIVYLTEIQTKVSDADTYFPELSPADWLLLREVQPEPTEDDEFSFVYKTFLKSDLVTKNINW